MKKPTSILAVIATALVSMLVLTACGTTGGEAVEIEERRDAPPIEGTDPITGEQLSLAQFEGKPVIVNFWASWCGPCKEELPAVQELADRHPEAQVLGVNFQDSESGAREIQAEIGFDFPSVSDPRGEIGVDYTIPGMPTTFFLDSQHRIAGLLAGGADLEQLEQGLELAAGG
ncbi:MAG: TlpA family protein disulfide reductase [Gaiellaceae bacterium]